MIKHSRSALAAAVSLASIAWLSGCASLASFQDARPIEKGTAQAFVGVGPYEETNDGLSFPYVFDLGVRYGLLDRLDVGAKYTVPGGVVVDGKYLLVGGTDSSLFGMSTGLKGGYLSIESGEGDAKVQSQVFDATLPVYLSVYPKPWLALTVIPDATLRIYSNDDETSAAPLVGGNANVRLGRRFGVFGEAGYHQELKEDFGIVNYAGGIFWTLPEFNLPFLEGGE